MVRGITNIGQTCFLAVIVQSIVHNPLLRSYFLADRHNRRLCPRTNCMSCQMDLAFSEVGLFPSQELETSSC